MGGVISSIRGQLIRLISRISGDRGVAPKTRYLIPILKSYDDQLVNCCVTPVGFDDLLAGKPPSTRRKLVINTLMVILLCIPARFAYLSTVLNDPIATKALGDPLHVLGDRIMVNCCMCACHIYFVASNVSFFFFGRNSSKPNAHYWCIWMAMLKNGVTHPRAIGIELARFKIFRRNTTLIYYLYMLTKFNLMLFFVLILGGSSLYVCYDSSL